MAISYDTTDPAQTRYAHMPSSPPPAPVHPVSSSGGFAAAALVCLVFVVVGILFGTIPNNTFFMQAEVTQTSVTSQAVEASAPAMTPVQEAPSN